MTTLYFVVEKTQAGEQLIFPDSPITYPTFKTESEAQYYIHVLGHDGDWLVRPLKLHEKLFK